ncbi:MAG: hypothetical protein AAF318_18245 [Pseudomonadota bacterium]
MRILVVALALWCAPALAFDVTPRGAVTLPVAQTNGTIDGLMILCRRDFVLGVLTPARRLRSDQEPGEEERLFDTVFGRAVAVVDERRFDLGAGGANDDATVYLFAKDREAFLAALHTGRDLALAFDLLPEDAKDGAGFETVATFTIAGLGAALQDAGRACRVPEG